MKWDVSIKPVQDDGTVVIWVGFNAKGKHAWHFTVKKMNTFDYDGILRNNSLPVKKELITKKLV